MKDLTLETLISVFVEMMGMWFWLLLAFAVAGFVALVYVVVRDRGLRAARLAWSEVAGVIGGFTGIWIALAVTNSRLADIGGPADWVLMVLIWVLGAIGGTIVAYLILSLVAGKTRKAA